MSYYIGLMSGTSMDGIDAALVDVNNQQLLDARTIEYQESTRALLNQVTSQAKIEVQQLAKLNRLIGLDFAQAALRLIESSGSTSKQINAIGSHGQTIAHFNSGSSSYSLQLGCPSTIAYQTGLQVVADFRSRDIAYGGQGAPLAPIYHEVLFSDEKEVIAVVNVGGISNISFIDKGRALAGYDIGPGNCLMDFWANRHLHESFDKQGLWAMEGNIHHVLLSEMLKDPYLQKKYPKSIGKEYYLLGWLNQFALDGMPPQDIQATFLAYTAETIKQAIAQYDRKVTSLYICGGGAYNTALLNSLSCLLPNLSVMSTEAKNISPGFIEAMMMAWLASKTVNNEVVDLRHITGSEKPITLGNIYKP